MRIILIIYLKHYEDNYEYHFRVSSNVTKYLTRTSRLNTGIRLDDITLRVIHYEGSHEEISPQRGDRLCALGGETVRDKRDVRSSVRLVTLIYSLIYNRILSCSKQIQRILQKHRQGPDQHLPIVGTFVVGLSVYTLRLVSGQSLGITMSNEGLVVRKLLKEASRAVQERVRVGDFCVALNGYVLNTSNKLREALRRVNSSFETHYEITFGRHRKFRVKDDVIITDSKEEEEEEEEVKYLKQETEKSLREEHDRIEEEKERKKRNEIRVEREKSSPPPVTLPQPSSSNMKSISRNILSSLLSTKNENDLFEDHVVSKKKKPQSPDVVLNSADALKDLQDRIETAHDVQSEIEKFNITINELAIENHMQKIANNLNIDPAELKKYFELSRINYEQYRKEVEIEFLWQKLITQLYSSKIDIDNDQLDKQVLEIYKNKEKITEFKLAELEINYDKKTKNELIKEIKNSFERIGFSETVVKYSISNSALNKGEIGWVSSKVISNELIDKIEKLKIGEISSEIIGAETLVFYKMLDKRFVKDVVKTDINQIRKKILKKKKNELLNLYSNSHLSKKKNNTVIKLQ